jgi:hypothetical protein
MSLPKSPIKYDDIASDLNTIMYSNGRRQVFSTPAKAQRWRMRAYMYRTLLEEQNNGSSLFSTWVFRITKAEPNVVTILTEPEKDGWLEDADGNRIEPLLTPQEAQWQEQAEELRRKLGFDDEAVQGPTEKTRPQSLSDLGL